MRRRGDHPRSRGVYSTRRSGRKWRAGSSPLARGLRRLRPQGAPPSRIIPARAGFTASLTAYRARPGDHPRSRGVYRAPTPREREERIIPARAGFTVEPRPVVGRLRDHPRSRGVYARSATISSRSTGSSPLARGLREAERAPLAPRRIIPARAGFTARPSSSGLTSRDHPRSRGVYSGSEGGGSFSGGSSPLARGLHPARQDILEHRRIIPARAGFTGTGVPATAAYRDHPRSRGVYLAGMSTTHVDEGSSPLARGLLTPKGIDVEKERIIPARAGFTRSPCSWSRRTPDHPRSRGVYRFQAAWAAWAAGSSPLARGLLGAASGLAATQGIIPARAGFTVALWRGPAGPQDHPRSRGVYPEPLDDGVQREGSSPLARGLLGVGIVLLKPVRIIPARAGFTRRQRRRHPTRRDHPRSRGVYLTRNELIKMLNGSSPLARGLRDIFTRAIVKTGIIPARAGFTFHSPYGERKVMDHPRSRGVYNISFVVCESVQGSSPLARGLQAAQGHLAAQNGIIPARAGFTKRRCRWR
mgnify:FL=1